MGKDLFKKWGWSVSAIFLGGVIIVLALVIFNMSTMQSLEAFIHRNMEEANDTAISSMNYSFENFTQMLEQQSKMMSMMENPTDNEIMEMLKNFSTDKRFERVSLITFDGKTYSSEYGIVMVSDLAVVPNLKNKATTITGPRKTDNGELVIDIGTPAYTGGEAVGRLNATIGNEELKKMYTSNSLQGDAGLTLFMRDGMVLTNISNRIMKVKEQENLFKHFNSENVHFTLNSPQGIAEDVQNGRSGWVKYWHNGHSTCIYYKPFGINDWYMAISATDNTLEMQAGDIKAHGNMLTAAVLITVCLVAVIVMIQRVKEQERMDALKNTYSVAIRKTNDLFYEADIDSDELIDRSESGEKAVWKETPKNYSNALTQIANVCAPECRQQFLDTFLPQNIKIRIKEGISSINFEYKITPDENTVRWLSATLVPVVDNQNKSTKLICMENDITEEMLHRERLKRSATLDGLTGLYNKITTQNYIDQFLLTEGKDGHHALLIIDIDSFKSINDNLGHAKGDEVLRDCGDALRKIFRKNDIVGRIGGDEFAVLIKDYGVIELVKSKCEEICRGFYKEQSLEDDKKIKVTTSASIGAAFYSEHGKNFDTLYKNADSVLYEAKKNGKNGYKIFKN